MSPFDHNRVLKTPADVKRLAERLATCPGVSRHDQGQHREAWALAGSFADLEDSFRAFLDEQLPALADGHIDDERVSELLIEIGVEFDHILYHVIKQPRSYRHLYKKLGDDLRADPD